MQRQSASLFDYLVRAGNDLRRHREAERLDGLEIDGQFDLGGLLNRQVGRLFSFKDFACIEAGEAKRFGDAGAITHQATRRHILPEGIDRRHFMPCGKFYNPGASGEEEGVAADHECTRTLLDERDKGRFQFAISAGFNDRSY
jgi:hypothetical protein